jgi:SAM-dependent methyltransferase
VSDEVVALFTRAAPTYGRVGPSHFEFFAERLVPLVRPGDAVLDVGTGTGITLRAAAGRAGRLVGVDITAAMLARARAELPAHAELYERDAADLGFPDASFDVVLCSFVLQTVRDKVGALTELHRVLRPGGAAGVVYPLGWPSQGDPRWQWIEAALRSLGGYDERRVDTFGPDELRGALGAAGFAEVEVSVETCPLVFADEEEWWRWSWSHGTRALWEAIPPSLHAQLERIGHEGLRQARADDGSIHGSLAAAVARARG